MKYLDCTICGSKVKVADEAISTVCYACVIETTQPPESITIKKKVGYPRGWKFMSEFVHIDGTVYFKGVEQPKLKGKRKPTVIEHKPKQSKREKALEKQSLVDEFATLKKKLKSEKRKTYRKKIELRLNKLSKLI